MKATLNIFASLLHSVCSTTSVSVVAPLLIEIYLNIAGSWKKSLANHILNIYINLFLRLPIMKNLNVESNLKSFITNYKHIFHRLAVLICTGWEFPYRTRATVSETASSWIMLLKFTMMKQCECIIQISHRKREQQYNTVLGSEIYFDMVADIVRWMPILGGLVYQYIYCMLVM